MRIRCFEYPGCPYCRQARKILAKLKEEHPEYKEIDVEYVDEVAREDIASQYDYYYTPCFFDGEQKLYEADPSWGEKEVTKKLDQMMKQMI